ncbi:hypothetical protein V1279_004777 [Bradyrhizobium sp. AZCC 1610]
MSKEEKNKAVVGRWFKEFWGNPWNPDIVDELAAPDILLQYSLHEPRRGRKDVKEFMIGFRNAFPDLNFWGAADLIAEGDYVVGRWEGGVHTPALLSMTSSSDHCRQLLVGKCASPELPCSASRAAKSRKRSAWTTARPRCNSSTSCARPSQS